MNRPRLVPELPFPPYTFVPGQQPHPFSDPRGHSYGPRPELPEPVDERDWQASRVYLFAIDLFNHGYYWEAHEAWETLWHVAGRSGRVADFLKGLIHLAAAGVKVREGKPAGVRNHAQRAAELFRQTGAEHLLGLDPGELAGQAGAVARTTAVASKATAVVPVFDFVLCPR